MTRGIALALALLAGGTPALAQGGFDHIGPDDSLTSGTFFFTSQDQGGSYAVCAQPWVPPRATSTRELWVVWSQSGAGPSGVTEWRVGVWRDQQEVIDSPNAGTVVNQTFAAPDLGDTTTPFGTTADGRDTYLFGFTITEVPLSAGQEFHFAVQAVGDIPTIGLGGVVESAAADLSGVQVSDSLPGGWSLIADLGNSLHDGTLGYQLVTAPSSFGYCFGDGSGSACPCGNEGDPDRGCGNSAFPGGARLEFSGGFSVSDDTVELRADQSRPSQPGLFFQGDNAINGGDGLIFGDGLRCAGGGVVRLEVVVADAGGVAVSTVPIAMTGGVTPGDLKRYQWWYRDPGGGSPCGTGFNLSNGLEIPWMP